MGLLRRLFGGLDGGNSIPDGVAGQAQVVSSTSPHSSGGGGPAVYKKCRLHLVVQAEGIEPTHVEHSQLCPTAKWPFPGAVVPVVVSRSDPTRLRIDFDQIPDADSIARAQAQQQAEWLRTQTGGAPPGTPGPMPPPGGMTGNVQFVGGGPEDLTADQRAKLRQLGIHIDAPDTAPPAASPNDRLDQLERLTRLHASGALTDAEFAAEKKRLLEN